MKIFRIHGDNIVECERIANIIIKSINLDEEIKSRLISPSTIVIDIKGRYNENYIEWKLELLPGFNKNTKRRWEENIFDSLKDAGSFFDETPDAIISHIDNDMEKIILGIEFCSALQAGNQAWQRSARAFSTGRTGCPYLYIVDFVKYELDKDTRERKNLRFPNPAVPYSYINYSKLTGNFIAQLYVKSEEFDKTRDINIANFNDSDFGSDILGIYIIKLMIGLDTSQEEEIILNKNMNVVQFLADRFNNKVNFSAREWNEVYSLKQGDIVDYAVKKNRFGFHKSIAAKSHHGFSSNVVTLVDQFGVGLTSKDLPFGIIPANNRSEFAKKLYELYPNADASIIKNIGCSEKHMVIALIKGFKPRGDDNRPDRGLLPLAVMLSSTDVDILTYIYGPLIEENLKALDSNPIKLSNKNGLWRSILSLSNFVVLDVPVLAAIEYDAERVYDTSEIKNFFTNQGLEKKLKCKKVFSCVPLNYGEDDVDTGIHYLFTRILKNYCFEGMCNPPGGDWSGFSVIDGDYENRWLSLPRVSDGISGKRPDHILELFSVFDKPLLLSIESKERSIDLEPDVGIKLITYIKKIMGFIPSAKRKVVPFFDEWSWGNKKVDYNDFEMMSAAAYLKKYAEPHNSVFNKNCEILFVMNPVCSNKKIGWEIEIVPSTKRSEVVKEFIIKKYKESGDNQFILY